MGSIAFNKQNNRLKRTLPGLDHYTGLVFYSNTVPVGFAGETVKEIFDLPSAEALGITAENPALAIKIMHYHIKELFRLNPDAVFYLGVFAEPVGAHTFNEVATVRAAAGNKLRQIGVWTKKPFVVGDIALLQDQYDAGFEVFAPVEILYSPNLHGVLTADIADLAALTSPNVHLVIAQDGKAVGKDLYVAANTYSIGAIGATLGATSLAKVHENIGWVEKFNFAQDGGELDVPALVNGALVGELAVNITKNNGTLDSKRLMFLKKYPGITGTYFNETHGACPATSDYAYMEDNRAIDKAIRGIYVKLMPFVNGPTLLEKGTGKLRATTVDLLTLEAGKALEEMEKAGELSGYAVAIDPNQDVNATNQIVVNISNTKVGVSRNFIINIGY